MKTTRIFSILCVCVPFLGCLDKPDDKANPHAAAAINLVDGVAAYQDIHANVETNPEAAKDALLRFIKAPIAGAVLLGEPGDFPESQQVVQQALSVVSAQLPQCLQTTGMIGCGGFSTVAADGCQSGDFTFKGSGTQMCTDCQPAMGCTYGWDLDISYVAPPISLSVKTKASNVEVTPSQMSMSSTFDIDLQNDVGPILKASLRVCSCGPITFDATCENGKSPTSGTVITKALLSGYGFGPIVIEPDKCVRAQITACNEVTVDTTCACPNGATAVCPG